MNLKTFNQLHHSKAKKALATCCGSGTWVKGIMAGRPFRTYQSVLDLADKVWLEDCVESDWLEAFEHHPKIGDLRHAIYTR